MSKAATQHRRIFWMSTTAIVALSVSAILSAGEEKLKLADGPGKDLTQGFCITCHSVDYISMNAPVMDRARWEKTVAKMVDKFGAPIDKQNAQSIVDYLAKHYSAAPAAPAAGKN